MYKKVHTQASTANPKFTKKNSVGSNDPSLNVSCKS